MIVLQPRILLPVVAALVFAGLAFVVLSGRDLSFDRSVLLLFRAPSDLATPLGPPWLREAMRDLTSLGSFAVLGTMLAVAALMLRACGYGRLAAGLLASVLGAMLISTLLKIGIGRERPDIVEHAARTFTASFPSGHAFLSTVVLNGIAGFVGLASGRADIARLCVLIAWALIVTIGVSRIYLGVHWPSDVLGGWCLGLAWSSLAVALVARWSATPGGRAEPS